MKRLIVILILILLVNSVFAQSNKGSIFGDDLPYVEQSLHLANGIASVVGIIISSIGIAVTADAIGPAYHNNGAPDMFYFAALDGMLIFNAIYSFSMAFSDYGAKKCEARRSSDPRALDSYRTRVRFPNFELPQTLDPDFYIDLPLFIVSE